MKPESRTPLHVTVFVFIITLLIMTACGIGKTGSGAGTDINSQTESALANDTAPQTDSDSARKILEDNPEVDILQVAHMHITVNEKVGDVPVGGSA